MSAVSAGVAEVRKVIAESAAAMRATGVRSILFLDEIHRFSKSQQDALLPAVEDGTITLIGATTENPYFSVNSPLLSRSALFRLEPLGEEHIRVLLQRAVEDPQRGIESPVHKVAEGVLDHIIERSGGDARAALNALEMCAQAASAEQLEEVPLGLAQKALQGPLLHYDQDAHYDVISAFIKSMRGSDPDAAVWWLAEMLQSGEDARFIARRMVIFASEDVGNADPQALVVAVSAAQAVEFVGLPEVSLNLAQAAIYLAAAPKSNASTTAISSAIKDVQARGRAEVPAHLRDAHYRSAAKIGHGQGYRYPHDSPGGFVNQTYLPPDIAGRSYYRPTGRGAEREIGERLAALKENKNQD